MRKIGLLSDTHGTVDLRILNFFAECDEIWHAGDIGNLETAEVLSGIKPLVAVHGNVDDYRVRSLYPEIIRFRCEDVDVLMMHIGGYPERYEAKALRLIKEKSPGLFISGHSHILKAGYDEHFQLLHINPGAAGNSGIHQVKTAERFKIHQQNISQLEILEIPRK